MRHQRDEFRSRRKFEELVIVGFVVLAGGLIEAFVIIAMAVAHH